MGDHGGALDLPGVTTRDKLGYLNEVDDWLPPLHVVGAAPMPVNRLSS